MRIYITKMQFQSLEEDLTYYAKAHALIAALREHGHETVYIADAEFNDYEYVGIFKALASCDCLLAFTDKYTCSGTWRLAEITYAYCGMGVYEQVDFHIPVFIYRGIDDHNSLFLRGMVQQQPDVHVLPDDIADAVAMIETNMKEE